MKCAAMQKKKPNMSVEERRVLRQLTERYRALRRSMGHEEAMEQLRKEAESANESSNENITDK